MQLDLRKSPPDAIPNTLKWQRELAQMQLEPEPEMNLGWKARPAWFAEVDLCGQVCHSSLPT